MMPKEPGTNHNTKTTEPRRRAVEMYASAGRYSVHHTFAHIRPWPLTSDLQNLSAVPTHMMNICAKFCWNPSTKYRDIASEERTDRRTDGQTERRLTTWKHNVFAAYCRADHHWCLLI